MAYDAFLKIDGITGESRVAGHEGEIEIDSFSFGLTNTENGGSSGRENQAVFQDFHFTSKVGGHSPQIFLACLKGNVIHHAALSLESVSGQKITPDLKITFMGVFFTEYKVMDIASLKLEDAVSPQGGLITSGPEDSASFSFQSVQVSSGGTTASTGLIPDALKMFEKGSAG
jgi:type VI protein secretion system component Hcp